MSDFLREVFGSDDKSPGERVNEALVQGWINGEELPAKESDVAKAKPKEEAPAFDLKSHCEAAVAELEPQVVARAATLNGEFKAEHAADVAAYKLECRRWGDFLSLFIERAGANGQLVRFSTSLNLGLARTIDIAHGATPNSDGAVLYEALTTNPAFDPRRQQMWMMDEIMELRVAQFGGGSRQSRRQRETPTLTAKDVVIRAATASGVPARPLFHLHEKKGSAPSVSHTAIELNGMDRDRGIPLGWNKTVKGFPRAATDDQISFRGARGTLYVPAGLGAKIHEQILQEIAQETCIVDDDAENGLLIRQGERLHLLVRCPSKGTPTLLSVPPRIRTAAEARAWTFGLTANEFNPAKET